VTILGDMLKACCLIGVLVAVPAAAQDAGPAMQRPRVSAPDVDWSAVRAALAGLDALSSDGTPAADPLAKLNAATAKVFAKIATSAVPVLLPFDTAAYLHDDAQGAAGDPRKYSAGFGTSVFFPGPSGYDAMLSLPPQAFAGLNLTFARPVDVQISGSALLYALDAPVGAEETAPAPELESKFPGIRRVFLENRVRYMFTRFGVPYFVSILCFDGPARALRLSCREADKVAGRFLQALNVVGGSPQPGDATAAAQTLDRPDTVSPDFTYYAPGDLLPGTGTKGQSGRADATVYVKVRFPLAQAPDYVNSQSFNSWGDCDYTGRVSLGHGAYRCRVNDRPLVNDESKNYAYPWRDNFCEHRGYLVGQCPAGLGHQGEDIRPSSCLFRVDGADRCDPYQHDIVAVADGVVMRDPGDEALYLFVNAAGEHVRFRYLHMDPHMLDAAGMVNGRELVAGEVIGAADDYMGHSQGGTTYHLHLDLQVPTRDGWVFVNPYMTLVAAYERLIGGRGQVVSDAMLAAKPAPPDGQAAPPPDGNDGQNVANSAAIAAPGLAATSKPATSDAIVGPDVGAKQSPGESRTTAIEAKSEPGRERNTAAIEHCTTRFYKGGRRRVCWSDVAATSAGQAPAVRAVDRGVPQQSHGARHYGGYVHARHAGSSSRHHGA
jgi:hypothetical protein